MNMLVLGLAGKPGVGKDTVADYLVRRYGFVKFAFSDALYREVQEAYGLEDQELLRNRATKDAPHPALALEHCRSFAFVDVARPLLGKFRREHGGITLPDSVFPLSPRQVLQWWGTEYRRAQSINYWLDRAEQFILATGAAYKYPEHRPLCYVEVGTRFPNEQRWVHDKWGGNVWHVRRETGIPSTGHVSDKPLPVLEGERELFNNDTIDRLWLGVDLLMTTAAGFVRVEPMEQRGLTDGEWDRVVTDVDPLGQG